MLNLLNACGYTAFPKSSNKEQLLSLIAKYVVIDKPRSALEQFKDGLETLGILQAMKAYPTKFKKLFCLQATELTATMLQELFCTDYSPTGSNHRPKEELIVMHWRDFLQECEGTVHCFKQRNIPECFVSLSNITIKSYNLDNKLHLQ